MEIKGISRILLLFILLAYATLLFTVMLDTYNQDYEGKLTTIRSRRGTKPFSAKFSTAFTSFGSVLHSPLIPPPHARKLNAYHTDNEDYNDHDIKLPQKMNENDTLNNVSARQNSTTFDHRGKETFNSVDNTGEKGTKKESFWKIFGADKTSNANGVFYGTSNEVPFEKGNGKKMINNYSKTNIISGHEGKINSRNKTIEHTVAFETDHEEDYDELVESSENLDYNWNENQYEYRSYVKHRLFTDLFRPEYLIENAKLCRDNPYIFAFINSRVNSPEIRRAIRQSYVQEFRNKGISYAFIISAPETQEDLGLLKKENEFYDDLIVTSDRETYGNLTLKTGHWLYWAKKNCLQTTYLAKFDDDVFVNVNKLMKILAVPRNFTVLGKICSSCQPNRGDDFLTLKESMFFFSNVVTRRHMPLLKLPPFAMGPAYIITRDAVEWMLEAAQYLFYFSYEDVFWTGLVVEVINKESGITFDIVKAEREEQQKKKREDVEIDEEVGKNTQHKYKANQEKSGDDMERRIRMDSIIEEEEEISGKGKEEEEEGDMENSIKYKYLTMKEEKAPKVTMKRENIPNFRSDRKMNELLSEDVIVKHYSSVIIHGIQWMKDKAFTDIMQNRRNTE